MKKLSERVKGLNPKTKYYLCYTLVFAVMCLIVFSPFIIYGKSFIWKPDGLTQNYNALVYFAKWMRGIIKTLLYEHRLSIPLWDFSIGYGSDVLSTLHYYVIGDPLNLLAVITPTAYIEYLYDFLILLRIYLSGVAFSSYCFYMNRRGSAVLAGSMVYAFCGYSLMLGLRFPFFLNALIYLPMLLKGTEKILNRGKPHLLIASTALSAVSNFYFFYMLVILVVIYYAIRFFTLHHESLLRDLGYSFSRMLLCSLTGVAVSAAVFLPVVLAFMSDARSDSTLGITLLYDKTFYEQFFRELLSISNTTANWTYLGFSVILLPCIFLLFMKRKRLCGLKIGFVLLTLMLLIPAAGYLMNGFSYPANRWSFGYAFLAALIVVYIWPELFSLSFREKCGLILLSAVYLAAVFFMPDIENDTLFAQLALLGILLLILFLGNESDSPKTKFISTAKLREYSCMAVLLSGIVFVGYGYYSNDTDNTVGRFVDAGEGLSTLSSTTAGMISTYYGDEDEFFRYAQDYMDVRNDSLLYGTDSITFYWSLSNGSVTRFFNELALPFEERLFKYDSLDSRSQLMLLAGVKVYASHDPNESLPYGFEDARLVEYMDEVYMIAETELYLPLGFACGTYISRETYESLSYIERQQALLQGAVCETVPEGYEETELSFNDVEISYEISYGSDIIYYDGVYYATEDGADITFTFEGLDDCETYLLIEGLYAEAMTELEMYTTEPLADYFAEEYASLSAYELRKLQTEDFFEANHTSFALTCTSAVAETDFAFYTGLNETSFDRSDYLLNMGYSEDGQTQITLTLSSAGMYTFNDIQVICLPVDSIALQVEALGEYSLEDTAIGTNRVSGTVSLDEDEILVFCIPWSEGWTVYVDGEESELIKADTMYMAVALEAGEHEIVLLYRTYGLSVGAALSAAGIAIWGGGTILAHLFSRKKKNSVKAA